MPAVVLLGLVTAERLAELHAAIPQRSSLRVLSKSRPGIIR
jgi:hypothetical protein